MKAWNARITDFVMALLDEHEDMRQYENDNPYLDKLMKNRAQELLAAAVARFMKQGMSKGWEQWKSWYDEVQGQLFMVGGAIRRMMHRKLSMAWEQWQAWYADMMEQRRKLDQALRRMMNRKLSMGWLRWRVRWIPQPQPQPQPQP